MMVYDDGWGKHRGRLFLPALVFFYTMDMYILLFVLPHYTSLSYTLYGTDVCSAILFPLWENSLIRDKWDILNPGSYSRSCFGSRLSCVFYFYMFCVSYKNTGYYCLCQYHYMKMNPSSRNTSCKSAALYSPNPNGMLSITRLISSFLVAENWSKSNISRVL